MRESTDKTVASMTPQTLLEAVRRLAQRGAGHVSSGQLAIATGVSVATVKRALEKLVMSGDVLRTGKARATRYVAVHRYPTAARTPALILRQPDAASPPWSPASLQLAAELRRPLMARQIVTYQRGFVDAYEPNRDSLLPRNAADKLATRARMHGQQPAGTYARRVLEQLLIDLSWSSSRLEGNRYSMVDTHKLFLSGEAGGDADAVMLLNHKRAIEFLVEMAPRQGLTPLLVRNLHATLMHGLMADMASLGTIRNRTVYISESTYVPAQVPHLLEEMFGRIVDKARRIANPVESAFFLWIHLAYLQAFEDGNKRTSRLAANVPLLLRNCAPLSFLGVGADDYVMAMMGVYERLDTSMAADLFAWAYERSIEKYARMLEAMGVPDPSQVRYRNAMERAVQAVVTEGRSLHEAVMREGLSRDETWELREVVTRALETLQAYNCLRFRISTDAALAWIARGRPLAPTPSGN